MNLFWKQGFHATSMQDIVQNVGLSRSSLYESFGSKQGLFDQALGNYCRTNRAGVKALLSNEKSVKTGIRNLLESSIHCTISDADKKGCFVVNSTTELVPGDDEMLKALSKNRASFEKVFFEFLQKGIYTVFSGLNVIAKLEKSPKKLMAQIDQIVGLLD